MQTTLMWKKGIFSNCYQIYSENNLVGHLKDRTFSKSADGELNEKKYIFKTIGFFKHKTILIDRLENKVIGEITYNDWKSKAQLSILDKKANWKYDNLFNTKWSIFDSEGIEIKYSGSFAGGQINSNTNDALLLLCGLFVTNYFRQMTIVVLVACFVPIWANTLHPW